VRRDYAKLGQMRPQRIDQAGALPHQPFPATVQQQRRLLLGRRDLRKSDDYTASATAFFNTIHPTRPAPRPLGKVS
jgi:hypothetical protein